MEKVSTEKRIYGERFKDRIVIVTGGGTGIGKACAKAFASEGGTVIIAGRREEPLMKTVKEIKDNGGKADYIGTDISKSKDVQNLIDKVVYEYGRLDVHVANASINILSPIEETSDKDVDRLIDINVKGSYYQLRQAVRQMLKQGYGSIVAISSMSGMVGHKNVSLYCASKAAIINMVRAVSYDVADKNIRVNAVCPGTIGDEGMLIQLAKQFPDQEEFYRNEISKIPMGRTGTTEEVARVALFLASDEASFTNGSCYLCDGGMTAVR